VDELQRRAAERGLPELKWIEGWPKENYSLAPLRAAVYAEQAGRLVSFTLAAYRQQWAGGNSLADPENVLIAAAACELHPNAIKKALETRSVKDRLREYTEEAIERGVEGIPTVAVGNELFWGDDRLEDAVAAASVA
jgi:2-hydroxychromene-2-carboxylate isomerase